MRDDVTFFSTCEAVIPFLEAILPELDRRGTRAHAVIGRGVYRRTPWLEDAGNRQRYLRYSWIPDRLARNKRLCALFYTLLVPLRVLASRSRMHLFLTEPPLFYVIGGFLSKLRGIPYVVYIMDNHLEGAVALGLLARGSLAHRLLEFLSDCAMRRALRVFVLGRCMRDRALARGVPPERVAIVNLWASQDVAPIPAAHNRFLRDHNLAGKFIVMYSGNMGLYHEIRTVLEVAADLHHRPELLFVFIGSGSRRREVEAAIAGGASNLLLLGFQDREFLAHSLSAGDVHFISLRPGCEGLVVPSKFYGVLAAGRPVIYEGSASGEVALTIGEVGCGRVVEHRDATALRSAILDYCDDREAAARAGDAGLVAFRAHFTQEHGATRCADLLEACLRGQSPDRPRSSGDTLP
jgi:colanic acid biosynthesis glycosyl transferase WcaI